MKPQVTVLLAEYNELLDLKSKVEENNHHALILTIPIDGAPEQKFLFTNIADKKDVEKRLNVIKEEHRSNTKYLRKELDAKRKDKEALKKEIGELKVLSHNLGLRLSDCESANKVYKIIAVSAVVFCLVLLFLIFGVLI